MPDLGEKTCEKEGKAMNPRQVGIGVLFVIPVLKSESKRSFDTTLREGGGE